MLLKILTLILLTKMTLALAIAFTNSMPPYYIEKDERGIELEIIKASFKEKGFDIKEIRNVNYKDAVKLLNSNVVNGVVDNLTNSIYEGSEVLQSNQTINYIDCAVALKNSLINLGKKESFSSHSVWAFKSAKDVLGEEFKKSVEVNSNYSEDFDQELQTKVLLGRRIDIIISDKNVFMYQFTRNHPAQRIDQLVFYPVSKKTPRNIKFKDSFYLKSFNEGLEIIKRNGIYDKILKSYHGQYFTEC